MANELHIGGGGSITDADLVSAITDELVAAGFSQGGGGYPAGTKIYRALLTQTGTNAPVATVLYNTFDSEPVWSRNNVGVYDLTFDNELVAGKTVVNCLFHDYNGDAIKSSFLYDAQVIRLVTSSWVISDAATPPALADDLLQLSVDDWIEVIVYP